MSQRSGEQPSVARAGRLEPARIGAGGWFLTAASTLVFVAFAYYVSAGRRLPFDASMLTWLHRHASPALTSVARDLSAIGEPTVVGPLTLLIVVVMLALRLWRAGFLLGVEVGGAAALDEGLKHVFARPRPTLYPHLVHETTFSFPSGHAVGDLAFTLALTLVLWNALPARWRWTGALLIVVAIAVGASRPYLQVHYPSDVFAGWALGLAWVLGAHALLSWRLRRPAGRHGTG